MALSDILDKAKQTAEQLNYKYNPYAGIAQTGKDLGAKAQNIGEYTRPTPTGNLDAPISGAQYTIDRVKQPQPEMKGLKGIEK
jgi:hypothetical protein